MKCKSKEGFTLFECLLVLLIVTVFIMIPIISLKKWKEKTEVEMFLNQVERSIQQTHQSAIVDGKGTVITQARDTSKPYLEFTYYHHGKRIDDLYYIEEPLELMNNKTIRFNAYSGNIQKIEIIKFKDTLNNRFISYQFQLGSGKVIRYEEKK